MAQEQSRFITIDEAKRWLRHHLIRKRLSIKPSLRKMWSRAITHHVISSPEFKKAKTLAVFISFGSEVMTDSIIKEGWKRGKEVLVPMTDRGYQDPYFVLFNKKASLFKTAAGPMELANKPKRFNFNGIDLVLAPGLGFDNKGFRLGYGGGVYDRLIEMCPNAAHMGLFFSQQRLSRLPKDAHDRPLKSIITEKGRFIPAPEHIGNPAENTPD